MEFLSEVAAPAATTNDAKLASKAHGSPPERKSSHSTDDTMVSFDQMNHRSSDSSSDPTSSIKSFAKTGPDPHPTTSQPKQIAQLDGDSQSDDQSLKTSDVAPPTREIQLRLLVRRREAGALIGKRGSNIKRLRDSFPASLFSIPDTGNGPERVVCLMTDEQSLVAILSDITGLLLQKLVQIRSFDLTTTTATSTTNNNNNNNPHHNNPAKHNIEQIELKLLIHSSHAGTLIGLAGQTIKRLRNVGPIFNN